MELSSACVDRQLIRFSRLQDDLVEWWNMCVREKSFCITPNAYAIDLYSLYDELSLRTCLFNKNNTYPDD